MENTPEDPHRLYLQIREKLNEMRASACRCQDLVEFEKDLEEQFAATKRAAKKGLEAGPAKRNLSCPDLIRASMPLPISKLRREWNGLPVEPRNDDWVSGYPAGGEAGGSICS